MVVSRTLKLMTASIAEVIWINCPDLLRAPTRIILPGQTHDDFAGCNLQSPVWNGLTERIVGTI